MRPKGVEPLTPSFVGSCSIQLSYGRMINRNNIRTYRCAGKTFTRVRSLAYHVGLAFSPDVSHTQCSRSGFVLVRSDVDNVSEAPTTIANPARCRYVHVRVVEFLVNVG